MQRLLILLLSLLLTIPATAQKREFRAAWIATVGNIDWPSKQGLPAIEQQQQFVRRLDQLKAMGFNAVIVQIRPASDAFYASAIEPWSRYITGRQGQPPFPYYDPLEFMVAEAHKRHMEFHAWFNPFRALVDSRKNPNPPEHVTRTHPEWIVTYDNKSYLNPGVPEARDYVIRVITDVVKRYDIDAVHLDDYFYPYPVAGKAFNDATAFSRFNLGITDKATWRRNNVDLFVTNLNNNIKAQKSWVKLGISPFGIWRNYHQDTMGSFSRGLSNYDDLYADVRLWLEKGWIDYAMPQLYWEHGHRSAPFEVLLPWWRAHSYGRHVYYGLGLYRMLPPQKGVWAGTGELLSQIRDIRKVAPGSGFALYSMSNFDKITVPIEDSLQALGRLIAIPPAMKWLDSIPPPAPVVVRTVPSAQGTLLQWKVSLPRPEPVRYAVYRFSRNEPVDLEKGSRLIALTGETEFLDAGANAYGPCIYVVTALDRLWNESLPSKPASTTSH